jgi:hypothetical protein
MRFQRSHFIEKVKPEYDECSELLAIFTSIGKSK